MPNGKPRDGVAPNRLGSKARCDALVSANKKLEYADGDFSVSFWVFVAGFSKESPSKPTPKAPTSLAEDMSKYLRRTSTINPCSWGTFEETQSAIREIANLYKLEPGPASQEVYTSTNLGHMPRVWLCWFFLKPQGWKVHFVLAKHSFTPKEWVQETVKFFTYLYRFVFKKWGKNPDGVGEHHRAFR